MCRLGRNSYIRYYDQIFTAEFRKELKRRRELLVAMANLPYYFEYYLKRKLPEPFEEKLDKILRKSLRL